MKATFKTPLLSVLLRVFGLLNLVAGGFSLVMMIGTHDVNASEVGVIFGIFISAFILLGMSQVIVYIGQTAFHTGRLCELLETQKTPGSVAATASLPSKTVKAPQNIIRKEQRRQRYFYNIDGATLGPVDRPELQFLLNSRKIEEDTFVCIEGEHDWYRLDEIDGPATSHANPTL